MIAGVADTHTALWHLFDDQRLSKPAADFIDQAAAQRQGIAVSSITVAEIVYLVEKGRLPPNAYTDLKIALANPNHVLKQAPFTIDIVEAMWQVEREAVPDMPDRLIAATAVYFGVPIISKDRRIRTSKIKTVW